ncbi:MAG: DUF5686 and carboxypeptidase regulatory-like domain-containing protein [Bacteroidales bacterium]
MNDITIKPITSKTILVLFQIKTILIAAFILFLASSSICAQTGIKGYIKDSKGKPLAYATLYIKELKTGTVANENGFFEYPTRSGEYHIDFRCLGYKSESKLISVQQTYTNLDIRLNEQMIDLKTLNIVASSEDPAYSIIRKAVAASYYYRMIVKAYDADIYIKGAGEVKMPNIVYKIGKSKGIDTVEYFTNESYNHIRYDYPNKYEQRVISARDNSNDSSASMVADFINASIYEPDFGGSVSPLSPSAFSFYRFKLINTFVDKGAEIHKISVIPRSKGSNVFSGDIYIVDKLWCVYNFNLKTHVQGFEFVINQMFAAVNDKTWVPINQQYNIKGSFFGVKVSWKYLASLSNYQLVINDSLEFDKLTLVDEKTEREYAKALDEERKLKKRNPQSSADTTSTPKEEDKFTLSDFKRTMKAYEKEAKKKAKEPEVVSDFTMKIDSMAFKKTTQFWDSIRPIPLTVTENKRSLEFKMDSIKAIKNSDSASSAIYGKTLGGIIFGKMFFINKRLSLKYPSPLINLNFNTVEGFNLNIPVELRYTVNRDASLKIVPEIRYGFSNKAFSAAGSFYYYFNNSYYKKSYIKLQGGRKVIQFNQDEGIYPFFNSITTLLGRKNYMKIYQNDIAEIEFKTFLSDKIKIKTTIGWAERNPLFNQSNYSWIHSKDRPYTSNAPYNIEDSSTMFPTHQAFTATFKLDYHPIVKYRKVNGKKEPMLDLFPIISLEYNGGFKNILGSDVDFHRLETSIHHQIEGYRRTLNFKAFAGNTFNESQLYFTDYKHFNGSKIAVDFTDPMNSYRLLDYYTYSTQGAYCGLHINLSMKKFLLTQSFWLNITGVRESISFNYLKTEHSPHYYELGYGLENILKIFKIEAFTSFENSKYKEFGIKLGISVGGAIRINRDDD